MTEKQQEALTERLKQIRWRAEIDGYRNLTLRDGGAALALVQARADVMELLSVLQQPTSERCGDVLDAVRRIVNKHGNCNRVGGGLTCKVRILAALEREVATTGAGEGTERDIWDLLNKRRCELIVAKLGSGFLTGRDEADYNALQHVAGLVRELLTPPLPASPATVAEGPQPDLIDRILEADPALKESFEILQPKSYRNRAVQPPADIQPCRVCGSLPVKGRWFREEGVVHCSRTSCFMFDRSMSATQWNRLMVDKPSTAPPTEATQVAVEAPIHALTQLLCAALEHPDSAEGNIRRVIEELGRLQQHVSDLDHDLNATVEHCDKHHVNADKD